jgi:hypothetical protein
MDRLKRAAHEKQLGSTDCAMWNGVWGYVFCTRRRLGIFKGCERTRADSCRSADARTGGKPGVEERGSGFGGGSLTPSTDATRHDLQSQTGHDDSYRLLSFAQLNAMLSEKRNSPKSCPRVAQDLPKSCSKSCSTGSLAFGRKILQSIKITDRTKQTVSEDHRHTLLLAPNRLALVIVTRGPRP